VRKAREEYLSLLARLDQLEATRDEADAAAEWSRYHAERHRAQARELEAAAEEAVVELRRVRRHLARLAARLRREGGR
jgi:ribosome recycling factor